MNRLRIILACALFGLLPCTAAYSATFYVDAQRGSDAWSGKLADPSGAPSADGPWQSLARLARATLAPGDRVALRCGASWSETLRISASGTAASPITVLPYPTPCVGPAPMIDGFTTVSGASWTRRAANLYGLQFPLNLLPISRFDRGLGPWRVWSPAGDAQLTAPSNCGADGLACMQIRSGSGSVPTVLYGSTFKIAAGATYRLRFDINAAAGVRVRAYVRRAVAPFDNVGASQEIVGTGGWQSLAMRFVGSMQLDNARLDFDLAGGGARASLNNVAVEQELQAPFGAVLDATPLVVAHHPMRGFDTTEPNSLYFRNGADSDVAPTGAGTSGSNHVVMGSDFALPAGSAVQPGTAIRIRTNAWLIEERTVSAVSGNRLILDRPTSFPLKAGWGYFLTGAAWMLDEPGEWLFDSVSSTFLLRTATDALPVGPLRLNTLDTCIDLSATRNVTIDGIDATGCRMGVRATGTSSAVLRNLRLSHMAADGIMAPASTGLQVLGSRIERSGQHAVRGMDRALGVATGMTISGNVVIDAGVTRLGGKVASLPSATAAALVLGAGGTVVNNSISGAGYHGIWTFGNGLVKGNLVDSSCLVLDDCAGIYAFGSGAGSRIEANVVRDIPGGMEGKPAGSTSQGQGIFLDDHATGVTVLGNTVSNAESGVLLHNAYANTVQGNVLYGNRKHQIWLYEDASIKSVDGDVFGNVIADNLFFSTSPVAAVGQLSFIKDTSKFATYDRNRYSALISSRVVSENSPLGGGTLDFTAWQRATTASGVGRNLEPNGSVVNSIGYAAFRVLGANIVRNGSMAAGAADWTPWNATAPLASARAGVCNTQNCLVVTGGGSSTLVATPAFSVVAGNWYRASVDLSSPVAQTLSLLVRRGGGGSNGYESLMGSAELVATSAAFKRYSFTFKATKTINAADPVTRDIGARLYFDRIAPGSQAILANVEIVPLSAAEATLQTRIFANPADVSAVVACPDLALDASRCGRYVNFATGVPIAWPMTVASRASVIAYTKDTSLVDSDGDGISDDQDQCPGTAAGAATNSKGCSL